MDRMDTLILTRSSFGLLTIIFRKFVTELRTALNRCQNLYPEFIFIRMDRILTKFIYTLILTRSRLGLLTVIFRKFVTELSTALNRCQNFDPAQYLENDWTEFDQILYTHLYWQDLGWDC